MKGFTLLEILVAISIVGIIMAAVYGAYTSNMEGIQAARGNSQISQTARIIFDRMSKDLQSAYLGGGFSNRLALGMVAENREINGRAADQIDFTALSHLPSTENGLQTDLCELGYPLKEDQDHGPFILYRRDSGIVDDDLGSGGRVEELARMVAGLDIKFQGKSGSEFEDWNTFEEPHKNTLPSLVQIRLILKDKQGREHTYITSVHPELAELINE